MKKKSSKLFVLLILLALLVFNFRLVKVTGISMEPTFNDGKILLLYKNPFNLYTYKAKDIILATHNNLILIKRITHINKRDSNNWKYSIHGDNQDSSYDSGVFGYIDQKDILGLVL
jgi:signal peptidase I